MEDKISIQRAIPETQIQQAVELYDQAFGAKLSVAIPDAIKRKNLFSESFSLEYAFAANTSSQALPNQLIGLAGFSTTKGSLTGNISYRKLLSQLGIIKATRAAVVLMFYERKAREGELLMDGVVVDKNYRGLGVGSLLFEHLIKYARENNYFTIRLDVIDTNPGAKRLYKHIGFKEEKTERFEFLRGTLGFGASTTMIYQL